MGSVLQNLYETLARWEQACDEAIGAIEWEQAHNRVLEIRNRISEVEDAEYMEDLDDGGDGVL